MSGQDIANSPTAMGTAAGTRKRQFAEQEEAGRASKERNQAECQFALSEEVNDGFLAMRKPRGAP